MSLRSIAIALILPAALLVPLVALGEPEPGAAAAKKKLPPAATDVKYDPENVVAISQFMEIVSKANAAYVAKDYTSSIDLYRKANQLAPKNALGPYLLAEAYLANGNLTEADASIAQAVELAPTEPKQSATKGRILFLRADIYEREKKWDQAKTAWQTYGDFSGKVLGDAGGLYPANGAERVKAIQKELDLEKQYVGVRERIAADKADAGKPPPPPKKK